MQTFSIMRRNSTNKNYLKIAFIAICLCVYVAFTDIYYFLPPLFGVTYVLIQEEYEQKHFESLYFFIPFLLYLEASKGLPLLSTILFIMLSFKILLPKFRKFFGNSKAFIPFFVFYAYFGYFAFLNILGWFFGAEIPHFSWLLGLFVACEAVLVWIFLWII